MMIMSENRNTMLNSNDNNQHEDMDLCEINLEQKTTWLKLSRN